MNPGADRLPGEVLEMIFSYLPCEDLVESVQFVCTRWQQVSQQMRVWKYIMYMPDCMNVERRLETLPQLRILNLISVNTLYSELIQFIIDSCPNLEHLYIHWIHPFYNIRPNARPLSQIKILSLFQDSNVVCSMDFPFLERFFPNLESLNIAELKFNKKDLEHYLQKKQDSLHTLSISCCTQDKLCVLPCLSVCTKLSKLTLYDVCDEVQSWEEVGQLPNISHLSLYDSDMSNLNDSSPVLSSFPNITTLVLDRCLESENMFFTIARNCPRLQELKIFSYGLELEDTLHAPPLERLTHLCIHKATFLTDEGIEHILRLMPQLEHLDLYECKRVTTGCLRLIYGIRTLKKLKFDLQNQPLPADLRASDVRNKDLQLMFYNCPDVSDLDALRQQHLRVCQTTYSKCRMDRKHFRNMSGHSWIKHSCLWCTNEQCSNSTHNEP